MAGHFGGNPYAKWDRDANAPHISRYFLTRGWVMPGETVIDSACCTGYGSKMIAQVAGKVIGLEIDEGCIEVANLNKPDNCEFRVCNLGADELPDADVAISIETMEHVYNLDHFLDQLTKHVRRMVCGTVPVGGTSQFYEHDPNNLVDPAKEKNDFGTGWDLDKMFEARGWKKFQDFQFGYSYFFVYYKKDLSDYKEAISKSL